MEARLKRGVRTSMDVSYRQKLGQAGSRASRSNQDTAASCRYLWHGAAGLEQVLQAASEF